MNTPLWELILRLVGAIVLGGVVGYQREVHGRPAGLRTHILVCLGSALFTIASLMFGRGSEPSRIAANIVTGIGFLGAGTIIRQGSTVRGLTTAASLWSVAAIGMAVGAGGRLYILAAAAALLVLAVLSWVDILEDKLVAAERERELAVTLRGHEHDPAAIISAFAALSIQVRGSRTEIGEDGRRAVHLRVKFPAHITLDQANAVLAGINTVEAFDWE